MHTLIGNPSLAEIAPPAGELQAGKRAILTLPEVAGDSNPKRKDPPVAPRVRVLDSKKVYSGKVVQLRLDRVVEPDGVEVTREVVCHSGSAVVLPRLRDGRVLLVRQFRYPARRMLWELAAGCIEPGETPTQAARRELQEETGYRARTFKPLLSFFSSPGFLDERMHLIQASGLTRHQARPEPDERIRLGWFTPRQLRRMLCTGQIEDAKTLVGLLALLFSKIWKK
jgi:ADP-ribose pyrophosphatase